MIKNLHASRQQLHILQSFSLLLLGAALSTLATLNFSLAFVVGGLAAPLSFVRPLPIASSSWSAQTVGEKRARILAWALAVPVAVLHQALSPPVVLYALCWYFKQDVGSVLLEMAKGWGAQGVYTSFVLWSVWWPAWVLGGTVLFSGLLLENR